MIAVNYDKMHSMLNCLKKTSSAYFFVFICAYRVYTKTGIIQKCTLTSFHELNNLMVLNGLYHRYTLNVKKKSNKLLLLVHIIAMILIYLLLTKLNKINITFCLILSFSIFFSFK